MHVDEAKAEHKDININTNKNMNVKNKQFILQDEIKLVVSLV